MWYFLIVQLLEEIKKAEQNGVAVGHFNFCELATLKAAMAAAQELGVPVILGLSEGEREFVTPTKLPLQVGGETGTIFFNADHTKSFEKVKEAVAVGYNAIIFDGSSLPFEENIKQTKAAVDYVKSVSSQIIVEGEIGYIGTSSEVHDAVPEGVQLSTPEEAVRFVKETGVDLLAPAVGNVHGIIKTGEPRLDIERIKKIKEALRQAGCDVPLVLHGASGNSDEDVRAAIKAGVSVVHINTEVRMAWRAALEQSLREHPNEVAPYKLLAPAVAAVQVVVVKKLKLFNTL